jgi:uncharacterized protein with PQ loop repeat
MSFGSMFQTYMIIVAFVAITSWLPQLYRIHKTKSSDDFSLITTAILVWANSSFLAWAIYNNDTPLKIQHSFTVVMLFIFAYLVVKYRSEPIFKKSK